MVVDTDVDIDTAAVLKAIAEPMRRRMVELLCAEDLCVCHLVDELDAAQPLVSHHLKVLRQAGLVESEKQGYWTWYRLRPRALGQLADTLHAIADRAAAPRPNRRPACKNP